MFSFFGHALKLQPVAVQYLYQNIFVCFCCFLQGFKKLYYNSDCRLLIIMNNYYIEFIVKQICSIFVI